MVIPGYEAGIDYVNARFPNLHFQHELIFQKSIYSCDVIADYSVNFAAEFYYRRKWSASDLVIFSAPNWNVPVVSIVGTSPTISNRKKYPTALTTAPLNNSVLANFFKAFLSHFAWTTLCLICDNNDVVAYYKANCGIIKTELKRPKFDIHTVTVDSKKGRDTVDYDAALITAGQSARVVIILARSDVTRQFMVFFYVEPHTKSNLPEFPNLDWRTGDLNDEVARVALTLLIVITFDNGPSIDQLPSKTAAYIKNRTASQYNFTVPPEQKVSAIAVSAFETTLMFALIANETVNRPEADHKPNLNDGASFAKAFLNRTFVLPTENLYVTSGGERYPDILASQLNSTSGYFEPVSLYNAQREALSRPFGRNYSWPKGTPPANEPYCGFTGQNPVCREDTQAAMILALAAVIAVMLCLLPLSRYIMWKLALSDQWWLLDQDPALLKTPQARRYSNSTDCLSEGSY
ncbi:putative Atrial natriuretic peptide receptor 1 [Hypsibius exemplaris]|uniref:Atrial natriuretic peptide receptor 1 n=1 Tax=Hypsibius exemplaris TaxID=2072580 RepID=A0A1W0WW79_HYPEX|nr:putative Atrial natriuretic peptide receptor 1 [Hypsibius exemplaris]